MKKILGIVLSICMGLGFAGCGSDFEVELAHKSEDINSSAPVQELEGCVAIAHSETIGMKYDTLYNSVIIYDHLSGETLCSTAVDEIYYGEEIKNNLTRNGIQQLITIAYTDYNNISAVATDTDGNCKKVIRLIENGIRFDFYFEKAEIQLSMELTLADDQLRVSIPADSLIENGNYGVTRIDVLPMLGAVNREEEGYFFFPDGCGALYQFGEYMGVQKTISMDVYDSMSTEIDGEEGIESNQSNVCLPVFGISLTQSGLFANIVSGAEDCSINLASAEGAYAVNRIYPSVRVRKQYPLKTASGEEVYAYQRTAYVSDFEIIYSFLWEDTSYSAMANIYREYLTENNLLAKNASDSVMALDFLMGVNKDGMLGGKDVLLTTFGDVENILEDINADQKYPTKTILYGWQKGGYYNYPSGNTFLKNIGSENELSQLCRDYDIYLMNNYINARAGNSGFSKQTDVIYSISGSPVTDYKETYYLLNPLTQLDRFRDDLELVQKMNAGIVLEGVGKVLYEDFDSKNRLTRYGYTEAVNTYLSEAGEKTKVCTDGYMSYFAESPDYVINLPDDTSNKFVWYKEVPFLQMVLHGSVDYSASLPGNLSSDFTKTKLRWIEYGYMPTFMLSGGRDSLLGTDYDLLFSSDYGHWKETITQVAEEFSQKLSDVKGEYMVSHESEDDVAIIKYANGETIIVNYNDRPIEVSGTTIPANDYVVMKD